MSVNINGLKIKLKKNNLSWGSQIFSVRGMYI